MVHQCEDCGYEMDMCSKCEATLCHDCYLLDNDEGLCRKCRGIKE